MTARIPELGARGGGWVVLQFALMVGIVAAAVLGARWPDGTQPWLGIAGVALAVFGAGLGIAAGRAMGRGMTPFPRPREGSTLVQEGPYRLVRHPVYLAGTLFFGGLSLATSPCALAVTLALLLVWALKARVEERFLAAQFPGYAEYSRDVRWRLLPWVY